jgi:hypothetical protein
MKNIFNTELHELSNNELGNINGGSELTDWILQKMGWISAQQKDQFRYESEFSYLYAHME